MKKILVLLVVIAMVGCGAKKEQAAEKAPVQVEIKKKTVRVMDVEESRVTRSNVSSGIIDPINEVSHITETGGDIIGINFRNGQRVEAGDVILVLKDKDITSNYLTAEADFISAQSDYDTKRINYNKFKQLFAEGLISEDEYLTTKNSFTKALSTLKMSEATYLTSKEDYENLIMKSKIGGLVADLDVKLYEKITKDSDLFTVVDDSKMRIKTGISGREINSLEIGSRAILKTEGSERAYEGVVYEINPVADENTKKYEAKVEVTNIGHELKKGMYANVLIETGSKDGFIVPKNAIVIRDLYSYIFVLDNENTVKRIRVENGYTQGSYQEVISPELTGAFKVVVEGQFLLEDRDPVTILN